MILPKRPLGKTGVEISILGLGGEGILRTHDEEEKAVPLIDRALDLGITYFESARAYASSESYYGMALKERRKDIFLASKSHERTGDGTLKQLEVTLKNMKTDFLDLWMIHDVRTPKDVEQIFGPKGAIKAFEAAKRNKLVRLIGISGHRNPTILSRALNLFPFDVVLMPVNPAEPHYWSFLGEVLPKAMDKGMGILGMKTLSRGVCVKIFGNESVETFLRFALTQPISAAVVGCDTIEQLEMNVWLAQSFQPMDQEDQTVLINKVKSYSREMMYYKL
ncbi:MAG: aldo/keto reductase [Deltaproteobacteria bacterium]|nr:aldo/keto reductase [Deltaproteobacteria bacterium]MBM4324395.1 aldo/keto reductase [Deltaproteobacteria bacterium]MBM4347239.1 aldo/keto reductase [Deltaproteobacteria bacterium]